MKKRTLIPGVAALAAGLGFFATVAHGRTLTDVWTAWENGDIEDAHRLATAALEEDRAPKEARHALLLTTYVSGDFETALEHYAALPESYRKGHRLHDVAFEALLFLRNIPDALALAHEFRYPDWIIGTLEKQTESPFTATLDETAIVPFADDPMGEYFPAFHTEINGHPVVAHVDTGGSFLIMGPHRAREFGIETTSAGKGRFHLSLQNIAIEAGTAGTFALGAARLQNIPVMVVPTLTGDSDFVIFGTRILHEFLSTFDYPNERLILSPRGDEKAKAGHLAQLPSRQTRMPFYLWSDHFMFAKGSYGDREGLNFFVDSGLIVIRPDENGEPKQCAFTTSKRILKKWGLPKAQYNAPYFAATEPLGLGALRQSGQLIEIGAAGDQSFGGVRIDGLLSHAFLKEYAWTIDFDAREYEFGVYE